MSPPISLRHGLSLSCTASKAAAAPDVPYVPVDADAIAYIATVTSAGATPTNAQEEAIDTFFLREKAAGRYSQLSRIYLPVWGVLAANILDLKRVSSCQFNGTVTHGAGYIQGNGTNGYMDFVRNPAELSITNTAGFLCALSLDTQSGGTFYHLGVRTTSTSGSVFLYHLSNSLRPYIARSPVTVTAVVSDTGAGVYYGSRRSGTNFRAGIVRGEALVSEVEGNPGDTSGSLVSTADLYGMALNLGDGSPSAFNNKRYGGFAVGGAMPTDNDAQNFAISFEQLWSEVTGLTLA